MQDEFIDSCEMWNNFVLKYEFEIPMNLKFTPKATEIDLKWIFQSVEAKILFFSFWKNYEIFGF